MPKRDAYDHGVPTWVDLATSDVDAAKDFYTELFGWDWVGIEMPGDGGGGAYWMGSIDGLLTAGLSAQPPSMQGAPSMWYTYVNVDDADDATAKAKAAGAQVMMPPQDILDLGRMSFVTDPAGAAIGMWQARQHTGAGIVNEPGALTWNEVYGDTGTITAFYGELFGWTTESMEMPNGMTYTMFKLGDAMVGGTMSPPMEGAPPHWHVWFATVDADATAAKATELGGAVINPPTDSPQGRMTTLTDPTGAAFSVIALNT